MKGKAKAKEFADEGYRIEVKGRHLQVTDPMKDYAIEKISKIERFSHRIIDVVVTMDIQKLEHRVDIVLKVDHLKIKAHAASEDMYASVDKAVDKLTEQLRRYKTRIQDHQAKGVKVIDMNVNVIRRPFSELDEVNEAIEEENERQLVADYKHEIVSRETRPLHHLTYAEAVMKMELSGDAFRLFISIEDNNALKVIYRRRDGNYGIIEPKTS